MEVLIIITRRYRHDDPGCQSGRFSGGDQNRSVIGKKRNRRAQTAKWHALEHNFAQDEMLRQRLLNKVDKYGNDVEWVDMLGAKWASAFRDKLRSFTNYRKGPYHTGMYTVSAHVPMGEHVGASADGELARYHRARMAGLSASIWKEFAQATAPF